MTIDGSIHVLLSELRSVAAQLSAENQDLRAASVWNAIVHLRGALSPEAQAEANALDRKRLERLRASA